MKSSRRRRRVQREEGERKKKKKRQEEKNTKKDKKRKTRWTNVADRYLYSTQRTFNLQAPPPYDVSSSSSSTPLLVSSLQLHAAKTDKPANKSLTATTPPVFLFSLTCREYAIGPTKINFDSVYSALLARETIYIERSRDK